MPKQPHQPLYWRGSVIRFHGNQLVRFLLEEATAGRRCDMNRLAVFAAHNNVPDEDQVQFAELIGYSKYGLSELSYVSDEAWEEIDALQVPPKPEDLTKPDNTAPLFAEDSARRTQRHA